MKAGPSLYEQEKEARLLTQRPGVEAEESLACLLVEGEEVVAAIGSSS